MVRDINDAIDILTESGARYYEIEGGGIKKKYEPEEDTHTNEAAVDQFSKDWERLLPGNYKITYRAKKTARQSAEHFRVIKLGDQHSVAGISENTYNIGLQQQIWNLEKKSEIDDLKRDYEAKLARASEGNGDGLARLTGAIMGILNHPNLPAIAGLVSSRTSAPVSGTNTTPVKRQAATPAIQESSHVSGVQEQNQLAEATAILTEKVYNTLDENATETAETFTLLAKLAEEKPAEFKQYLTMLKMM